MYNEAHARSDLHIIADENVLGSERYEHLRQTHLLAHMAEDPVPADKISPLCGIHYKIVSECLYQSFRFHIISLSVIRPREPRSFPQSYHFRFLREIQSVGVSEEDMPHSQLPGSLKILIGIISHIYYLLKGYTPAVLHYAEVYIVGLSELNAAVRGAPRFSLPCVMNTPIAEV